MHAANTLTSEERDALKVLPLLLREKIRAAMPTHARTVGTLIEDADFTTDDMKSAALTLMVGMRERPGPSFPRLHDPDDGAELTFAGDLYVTGPEQLALVRRAHAARLDFARPKSITPAEGERWDAERNPFLVIAGGPKVWLDPRAVMTAAGVRLVSEQLRPVSGEARSFLHRWIFASPLLGAIWAQHEHEHALRTDGTPWRSHDAPQGPFEETLRELSTWAANAIGQSYEVNERRATLVRKAVFA